MRPTGFHHDFALAVAGKHQLGHQHVVTAGRTIGIGVFSREDLSERRPTSFTSQAQNAMLRPLRSSCKNTMRECPARGGPTFRDTDAKSVPT
ncbi:MULTISPECIES: hypothetical protein [unclassified Bradyrhizobium]|uniref:hypothetical protein n=1 Tax=unclassified Bradyrhizobium TaxID=2631580 RepID=UPI001FFB6613|nr:MULTISPECIES: hypothetical protein [unclassified Bradyrhizobium]MCK1714300.1 hypothetical protein [Bradyrhizobium sp. 143]MCK1726928.1 hypothetical protein [Bradyrhizobium sp. 142]